MYQRSRTSWTKHIDFMILDVIAILLAFILAYEIRFTADELPVFEQEIYRSLSIVLILSEIIASLLSSNYSRILHRKWYKELLFVIILAVLSFALTALYVYSMKSGGSYSRIQLYLTFILFVLIDFLFRCGWKAFLIKRHHGNKDIAKGLVIVANESSARQIIDNIKHDTGLFYYINAVVLPSLPEGLTEIDGIPVVADINGAADYFCRNWIDEVLIDISAFGPETQKLEARCAEMGITVHHRINLNNASTSKQFIETIGDYSVLTTAYNYVSNFQAFVKRLFDIIGGLVGSIIAVLIIIFVGPVIYIASPGPILFKQTRIGKNGKKFTMYKLRSMYLDAEERKKDFLDDNRVSDGMMFKLDFDPRIIGNKVLEDGTQKTGIGEFIRKTSLDEFPQFFNVLLGSMSLVGTRPPTEDEWEKYQYHHRARLATRPGITGMWQVSGRSQITDFEEVVKLDTQYICNYHLGLDIEILFETIIVLFKRKGAM